MKQIWFPRAGGPEVMELREAADPSPGPGEVLIDVKAAGVNFADVMARVGKYGDAPPFPMVVGYEVAGDVLEVGPAAAVPAGEKATQPAPSFRKGDRVLAMTRFGGYSSRVCVPLMQVYRMPKKMEYSQAASIPVNYFTAYLALRTFCHLQPGENVLIHNAGGGVGVAAIQLAKNLGARVHGTASSWKHTRLRELGADVLIDYRTEDWVERLNAETGGPAMHVIIDPVGGKNLKLDTQVMGPLARLTVFGLSEPVKSGNRPFLSTLRSVMGMPKFNPLTLLGHNWAVSGLNIGHLWGEIDRIRQVGDDILKAWEEGAVRPEIAAEIPFEQAADAHRLLVERKNLGKVLLIP